MNDEVYQEIIKKKQFSELPRGDVEKAYARFDRHDGDERIKKTRELLMKIFSGFGGKRLLVWKDKTAEEVLKKHLSTRERFENYEEVYKRLLNGLPPEISVIDLGCGVNGFSYEFFKKVNKKVNYVGVEALGQLVNLANAYFKKQKIKNAKVVHESLFELEKIKKLISATKKPRVVFMFKVVDALENLERNYTKKLLKEIMGLVDCCVVSFSTESWMKRRKFFAQRTWLIDFIRENWDFTDDFNLGGERYLVFAKGN